jgi:hypothetical protein
MGMKIKTIKDAKKVADNCIELLVSNKSVAYFNLLVSNLTGEISNCYFSPVSPIRAEAKNMIFVQDIEKLLKMLLSHPKISELEYDPQENMISASFQDESEPEEEQILDDES